MLRNRNKSTVYYELFINMLFWGLTWLNNFTLGSPGGKSSRGCRASSPRSPRGSAAWRRGRRPRRSCPSAPWCSSWTPPSSPRRCPCWPRWPDWGRSRLHQLTLVLQTVPLTPRYLLLQLLGLLQLLHGQRGALGQFVDGQVCLLLFVRLIISQNI